MKLHSSAESSSYEGGDGTYMSRRLILGPPDQKHLHGEPYILADAVLENNQYEHVVACLC